LDSRTTLSGFALVRAGMERPKEQKGPERLDQGIIVVDLLGQDLKGAAG